VLPVTFDLAGDCEAGTVSAYKAKWSGSQVLMSRQAQQHVKLQ
jgi:hypothetical protein